MTKGRWRQLGTLRLSRHQDEQAGAKMEATVIYNLYPWPYILLYVVDIAESIEGTWSVDRQSRRSSFISAIAHYSQPLLVTVVAFLLFHSLQSPCSIHLADNPLLIALCGWRPWLVALCMEQGEYRLLNTVTSAAWACVYGSFSPPRLVSGLDAAPHVGRGDGGGP